MMNIIKSDEFVKTINSFSKLVNYDIFFIERNYFSNILKLQEIIINDLDREENFHPITMNELETEFNVNSEMIGIMAEYGLIAYHSVYFPNSDEREYNFGFDIALPSYEMDKVANIKAVMVHPKYRGHRLGYILNMLSLERLKNKGYNHIFATVSPYNSDSLLMFMHSGFVIRNLKYKYGNKLRCIVYNDITKNFSQIKYFGKEIFISNEDIETQKKYLNEGYVGVDIRNIDNQYKIVYVNYLDHKTTRGGA
ncbi:MAG: GNAT family N-acetyltransferase [Desulfobacterales bacterium]|nr:GNAT family N-acetyltransferase [Desulfobacterales bacterium]